MPDTPRFDTTSLGESMLRLSVPLGTRLDDSRQLDLELGGAEGNVCVALARLGWRTGWVSRLPDHALGSIVLRSLRADSVDVSAVRRVPGERLGTYFIEYAAAPRAIQVIYDRADSAAAHMTPADVDWDYLLDTRILHLTGITAALSDSCYAIVAEAVRRARAAGVLLSFDVNYRAKLWDAPTAAAKLRPLIAEADLLFCKAADAANLFGARGEPAEQLRALKALTRAPAICATFGAQGAALLLDGEFVMQPAVPVQIVDRIGSGDAFAAGVLDGWLLAATAAAPASPALQSDPAPQSDPALHSGPAPEPDHGPQTDRAPQVNRGPQTDRGVMRDALRRGVALAAIALSQYGDRVLTSRAELDSVLASEKRDVIR